GAQKMRRGGARTSILNKKTWRVQIQGTNEFQKK
ncbi:MAG: hypothetical protein ACI8RD_010219, partial [Bacillariaceae sp.]